MAEQPSNIVLPRVKAKRFKCYSCDSPCRNATQHAHLCNNALQCWKSRTRNAYGEETITRGCTTSREQIPFCTTDIDEWKDRRRRNTGGHYSIYCCYGDFCNGGDFPELPLHHLPIEPTDDSFVDSKSFKLSLAIGIPVFAIFAFIAAFLYVRRRRKAKESLSRSVSDKPQIVYGSGEQIVRATTVGDSTLREYFEDSCSGSRGGGLPLLLQKTLANQVSLIDIIGKGSFGEVWRGVWHGENVAVKIFKILGQDSWKRETEIYSTVALGHENILGYIGSVETTKNKTTEFWLLTPYYPLGSLYDYLTRNPINERVMLKMCLTICVGLDHLHREISASDESKGKPAIVHRDLKTKNILVNADGSCVIADLGLTVTYTKDIDHTDFGAHKKMGTINKKVGTIRYMAPEVLDGSLNIDCFEDLKRTDVYALGLILWEICKRMTFDGISEEFMIAYADVVPREPSEQVMKKAVVDEKIRPTIPNKWTRDPVLSEMSRIMKECWHHNAYVRLPILNVRKKIKKIIDENQDKLRTIDEDDEDKKVTNNSLIEENSCGSEMSNDKRIKNVEESSSGSDRTNDTKNIENNSCE